MEFFSQTQPQQNIFDEKNRTEIFELFKVQSAWSLKEMNSHLNQPASRLKQGVKKICDYIKKGGEKGKYRLKVEYITDRIGETAK